MNHLKRGMVLGFVLLWACSGGSGGTAGTDPGTDAIAPSDEAPDGIGPDTATSEDAPDAVRPDLSGGEDVPATDLPVAMDEAPGDTTPSETTTPASCAVDTDCKTAGQVCCKFGDMAKAPTCMADAMCPKNCVNSDVCREGDECCTMFGQAQKICFPGACP